MPRAVKTVPMSSRPNSLHAVDTPGVAPVVASHSPSGSSLPNEMPGEAVTGGGLPADPSSMALKAEAQSVAPLTASAPSATKPQARAHSPQLTQTSQRYPDQLPDVVPTRSSPWATSKHLPQPTQTAHRVPFLSVPISKLPAIYLIPCNALCTSNMRQVLCLRPFPTHSLSKEMLKEDAPPTLSSR